MAESNWADTTDESLSFAERFFHYHLTETDAGQKAVQYLGERGYGRGVADEYGLGWAPDSWDALLIAARRRGFSASTLVEAGLVKPRQSSGHYDRFRNRLIFPLYSEEEKPLGFAGRLLSNEEEGPKYINSPATDHYDKDRYLYGMWRAGSAIEKTGTAVITEGYTDVITLQSEGLINVVASSGTALTRTQVGMLSNRASKVVFAYDPDEAGVTSTIRGMKRAIASGLVPRAAILPDGLDPHEYAREEGLDGLRWWLEKQHIGLGKLLTRAAESGDYEPEATVEREIVAAAESAPTEPLRQMILLEASRHLEMNDRQLFSGQSQSGALGFAT